MNKTWTIQSINSQKQTALSDALKVHPIVARLLMNRGVSRVEEARQFLSADMDDLHDPFLMKGMRDAVDRIKQASADRERVMVFGDYDVDGITSLVLLTRLLKKLGIDVVQHIPHRMVDGYGLNHGIGELAKEQGVSLLITIDCGITANREIEVINALGVDVIVMDHHEPSAEGIPQAAAVIDPKQEGCHYPFKGLASVGLAGKLIQAILGRMERGDLELIALGTIADIAPLRGENRILVKAGLPLICRTNNKGLAALLEVAKIRGKAITPFYVGFVLGPRINAAGRMDTAHTALDLFLSDNTQRAKDLAAELDRLNRERQKTQMEITAEAIDIVEQDVDLHEQKVIVLSKKGWHKGVLGIVASRITNKYARPSIMISVEDGIGTASARSAGAFDLHKALEQCAECLDAFGGHKRAAGLTIKEENIDPFRDLINQVAQKCLEPNSLSPAIPIDCEIPIDQVSMELANMIDAMQPFGESNPIPVFCSRNLRVKGMPQALGKNTLKFWVTDGTHSISAVGFGMADQIDRVRQTETLDLAYEISIDDWNKTPTPQLKLKDIKVNYTGS